MEKQITINIKEEVLNQLKEYSEEKTGSKKAVAGTINKIIEEYINRKEKERRKEEHRIRRIDDMIEYIEEKNPRQITIKEIERVIQEMRGLDKRTIEKYKPIMKEILREDGYREDPRNEDLLIR